MGKAWGGREVHRFVGEASIPCAPPPLPPLSGLIPGKTYWQSVPYATDSQPPSSVDMAVRVLHALMFLLMSVVYPHFKALPSYPLISISHHSQKYAGLQQP